MSELTLHPRAHTQEPPSGLKRWPAWLAVHAGCSRGPRSELGAGSWAKCMARLWCGRGGASAQRALPTGSASLSGRGGPSCPLLNCFSGKSFGK